MEESYQPCRLTERPFTEFARLYPGHFFVEPKWDGERVLVSVTKDKVEIKNRYGTVYNFSFLPDYEQSIRNAVVKLALPLILDAEFVSATKPDLYQFLKDRVQELDQTRLTVFDVLMLDGRDVRGEELVKRKKYVSEILDNAKVRRVWFDLATEENDVWRFYQRTINERFEGVVVKPAFSIYTDGAWCKLKKTVTHDVVILGVKKTALWTKDGIARSFLVGFVDETGRTVPYGNVSSGWQRVTTELRPTGLQDDEYVYVSPEVVVEIMAHSLLETRKFREPRIIRERSDKRAIDCKIPDGQ